MPKRALLFALSVAAAGAVAVAAALVLWPALPLQAFGLCLGLAVLGATFKVKVPGITGTISPGFVPVLFAAVKLSWQETVLSAAALGLMQCLWRARKRPTALQVAFNGANLAIASGLGWLLAGTVRSSAVLAFVVAAIVFQVADTLAVSTVLCLIEGGSIRSLWRNCHLWSFPYILTGGALAAVVAQAHVPATFPMAVLAVLTLYLMSMFFREVAARAARA